MLSTALDTLVWFKPGCTVLMIDITIAFFWVPEFAVVTSCSAATTELRTVAAMDPPGMKEAATATNGSATVRPLTTS